MTKPGTDKEEPPKKTKKKKTPEKIKLPKKTTKANKPATGKYKTRGEKRLILLLNFSHVKSGDFSQIIILNKKT